MTGILGNKCDREKTDFRSRICTQFCDDDDNEDDADDDDDGEQGGEEEGTYLIMCGGSMGEGYGDTLC